MASPRSTAAESPAARAAGQGVLVPLPFSSAARGHRKGSTSGACTRASFKPAGRFCRPVSTGSIWAVLHPCPGSPGGILWKAGAQRISLGGAAASRCQVPPEQQKPQASLVWCSSQTCSLDSPRQPGGTCFLPLGCRAGGRPRGGAPALGRGRAAQAAATELPVGSPWAPTRPWGRGPTVWGGARTGVCCVRQAVALAWRRQLVQSLGPGPGVDRAPLLAHEWLRSPLLPLPGGLQDLGHSGSTGRSVA